MINQRTNRQNYENIMQQASVSVDSTKQRELLLQAIVIDAKRIEPYMQLVKQYKEDALYTLKEQEQLLTIMLDNDSILKDSPEYPSLAFQIGKLYWYYYDYGTTNSKDNQVTRMKSSIPWFEKALQYGSNEQEYYNMARVYYNIGVFNRDINLTIEEASDKGTYSSYWKDLQEMYRLLEKEEESDIVKLELYKVIANATELYARKFKGDGITKKELQDCYKGICQRTKEMSARSFHSMRSGPAL